MWYFVTTQDVRRGNMLREDQPSVQGCTAREGRQESRQGKEESSGRLQGGLWGLGSGGNRAQARAIQDLDRDGHRGKERGWRNGANVPAASTGHGAAGVPCPLHCPWSSYETHQDRGPPTPSSNLCLQGNGCFRVPPLFPQHQWSLPGAFPSSKFSSPPLETKTAN